MTPTQDAAALADELAAIAGRCSIEADRYTIIKAVGALRAPIQPVEADRRPIMMQDVRLVVGEGKLPAWAVLYACNKILRQRSISPSSQETRRALEQFALASPPSQPALREALREAESFMAYFANETDGHFVGPGTPTTCLAQIRAALATAPVPTPAETLLGPTGTFFHGEAHDHAEDVRAAVIEISEQERHAIEHARLKFERATDDDPDCAFDYELVGALLRVIDRALANNRGGKS